MFQFPAFALATLCVRVGVTGVVNPRPVSRFGDLRINARLPASRRLSQAAASFIASRCQDIHRTPLVAWPRLPIAAESHPTQRVSAEETGHGPSPKRCPTTPARRKALVSPARWGSPCRSCRGGSSRIGRPQAGRPYLNLEPRHSLVKEQSLIVRWNGRRNLPPNAGESAVLMSADSFEFAAVSIGCRLRVASPADASDP
jgi:hypothetical protein